MADEFAVERIGCERCRQASRDGEDSEKFGHVEVAIKKN